MIVVEGGSAYALNNAGYQALIAAKAKGADVSAANYGCEVCPVFGELSALLANPGPIRPDNAEAHDQFLVQIDGQAVLLSEEDWLAFLIDQSAASVDLRDYGVVLSEVVAMPPRVGQLKAA